MSWPLVKIGDLAQHLRNGASIKQTDGASGLPITRIETIAQREVNLDKCGYADIGENEYTDYRLQNGDILISHINSEKHLGKCAIFESERKDVIHGMNLLCFRPNEKLNPKFAFYFLSSRVFLSKLPKITKKSVNQASFTISHCKELEIPLPPLEEQKRIAAILDKADSVRRKRQQAIDLADDFLRSVFLDMFGDPLVNSKKWQVQNLGELTTKITDGKHGDCEDEVGSGYYFISAKDVNHGRINYENTRQINKKEFDEVHRRTDLQAGDLVMVNTGATIGRVAIVMDDEKTCKTTFQKSVAIIKPKGELLNSNFLKYIFLLRVKDFASVGSGSAIKNLLLSKMREFPIIVPPMELQRKFDRIVSHIESSSIRDSADSKLNDELFSSLSQKAFAGEL